MNNPRINILVLNWNGINVINKCVESIMKSNYENYCITIIDNGSTDNSIQSLINNEKINFIEIEENLGYAKGYNYAFEQIKNINDDYYLLLNNDTIINKDTVSNLVYSTNIYGSENIYGPNILNANNNKNWFCGGEISLFTGMPFHRGINTSNLTTSFKTSEVDYVSGCCMLLSKQLLIKLNGFNKLFKMYYEDVDLCLRAKKNGSKCYFVSNSSIHHLVSYSMGGAYSLSKYFKKIHSFIKFLYINNSIVLFSFYFIMNLLLSPFYIFYFMKKRMI